MLIQLQSIEWWSKDRSNTEWSFRPPFSAAMIVDSVERKLSQGFYDGSQMNGRGGKLFISSDGSLSLERNVMERNVMEPESGKSKGAVSFVRQQKKMVSSRVPQGVGEDKNPITATVGKWNRVSPSLKSTFQNICESSNWERTMRFHSKSCTVLVMNKGFNVALRYCARSTSQERRSVS